MDNTEKLVTKSTQKEEKTTHKTQYVLNTNKHKQTQIT